jgi:hypothetical protein
VLRDIGDRERAAFAVELVADALLVLGALEIGQYVVKRPASIAELTPMVEILGLAADIDHAVDRAGAAQHLAARPINLASAGVGLGLVAPVDRRVGKGLAEAKRDVDPAIGVVAARFEQQDACVAVLGEARGDRASGRAGADDDEIGLDCVALRGHAPLPHPVAGMMAAGRGGVQAVGRKSEATSADKSRSWRMTFRLSTCAARPLREPVSPAPRGSAG